MLIIFTIILPAIFTIVLAVFIIKFIKTTFTNIKKQEQEMTMEAIISLLKDNGFENYINCFTENKLNFSEIIKLKENDLEKMGITIVGDRIKIKKLLSSINIKRIINILTKIFLPIIAIAILIIFPIIIYKIVMNIFMSIY